MKIKDVNHNHAWRYKKLEGNKLFKGGLRVQKCLFIGLIVLFILLIVINTFTIKSLRTVPSKTTFDFTPTLFSDYLINTNGCRIPDFDPIDPNVMQHFIRDDESIICDSTYLPRLVESNDTAIFLNYTSKKYYYSDYKNIECCWSSFSRTEDDDNDVTYNQTCHNFQESALIDVEFVKVICWNTYTFWNLFDYKKKVIFQDYFAFVPRKPHVEERCQKARSPKNDELLSILLVGLDSVSRLNLYRQMPQTVRALHKLGAVEMFGYHKVGANTYPNLVPVFTGLSEKEFENTCWQNHKNHFDNCPFLWKNFSNAGYRTIFGEDACSITTFNYLKPGFLKPPTDYYLRPYCLAGENNIGNLLHYNAICVGSTPNFKNLLHYTKKVATKFVDDAYFAIFWESSLTHDVFDYTRFGDDDYSAFISSISKQNLLNKTAFIFMSDHGIRWGDFRQTALGKMEESLPFIFILLPDWWKSKFPAAYANLNKNTRSLTTPFDLHETILDMLDTNSLQEESLQNRQKYLSQKTIPYGISWFLSVPSHRNCETAVIPENFCTCHKTSSVSLEDPIVVKNIQFLVNEINQMLKKYLQCAVLRLGRVIDAKKWSNNAEKNDKIYWTDYTITLETLPGSAIFEGTIRNRIGDIMTLVGSVSRLNSYGKQSTCVEDFNMRLYCYCL